MRNLILLFLTSLLFISCSKKVEPIHYGEDGCAFCGMTIVIPSHAAQVVTKKGKNFKFDATECMINYLKKENNEEDMLHLLSANYLQPGEMLNVHTSTFLISEEIPSPMGANLSVFSNELEAVSIQKESGGELFSWSAIKAAIGGAAIFNQHSDGHH